MKQSNRLYFDPHCAVGLALVGGLLWGAPAPVPDTTPGLPAFELEDQFGSRHRAADLSSRFVAVIGSDRSGRDQSRAWAEVLQGWLLEAPAGPSVKLLRVADLRGTPRPLEPFVSRRLRRQGRGSVLLDWNGVLAEALGFEAGRANMVIFDSDGKVVFQIRGEAPSAEEVARVEQALGEVLDRGDDDSPPAVTQRRFPGGIAPDVENR